MITRIEIDGFKSFEDFSLDLRPFTAIVGPNASGKSNLFDALKFLSLLATHDIGSAMQQLRGEPWEQFRRTPHGSTPRISIAVEVILDSQGADLFGTSYKIRAQRLRYEVELRLADKQGSPRGVFLENERCVAIPKVKDTLPSNEKTAWRYYPRANPFLERDDQKERLLIRQDGHGKAGRAIPFAFKEISRTALSTINTAEFPHLYALRQCLSELRFLEINPRSARHANGWSQEEGLRSDASNLSAILAKLKEATATDENPDGVLANISNDLASLIPSIRSIESITNERQRDYAFVVKLDDGLELSSRVISDGTLRFLAILTILNEPNRRGSLCIEEPENGVHEGRIEAFVEFLRAATQLPRTEDQPLFQVLLNTHSPRVMAALRDEEIVAADTVVVVDPQKSRSASRTRMRAGIPQQGDLIDPDRNLTRFEVERLLRRPADAA